MDNISGASYRDNISGPIGGSNQNLFNQAANNPKNHIGVVNTESYHPPDSLYCGECVESVDYEYVDLPYVLKETIDDLLKPTGMTLIELKGAVAAIKGDVKEEKGNRFLSWLTKKVTNPIFKFIRKHKTFIATKTKLVGYKSSIKKVPGTVKRHVKNMRNNPCKEAKRVGKAGADALEKIPWVGHIVPIGEILLLPVRKNKPTKTYEIDDLTQKYLELLHSDIKSTKNFVMKKGPTTLGIMNKLVAGTKLGMSVAKAAGAGFTTQAVAAFSVISIVGSVLGLAVGSLGLVFNGYRLIQTGWKGTQLINIKIQAYKLKREADRLEEKIQNEKLSPEEKKLLEQYIKLYREESHLLHEFAKSQRREIATKAVRQTLNIAANVSLMAAGTSLILSASGFGAPVCIPLTIAFSALAASLFLISNGVFASSWIAGKGADHLQKNKKSKIQETEKVMDHRRSSLGTGVAKSNIGIATRVAMFAKLEDDLEQVPSNFFEKHGMTKPGAVKKYILDNYLEQDLQDILKTNMAKREKAKVDFHREKAEERQDYEKKLLTIAEELMEIDYNITFDELYDKLVELIDNPPDETADTKKGIWHKLTSGGAYQEWVLHLEEESIFKADDYSPKAA